MDRVLWDRSQRVIKAAMAVHTELGCGLLESTYEACLAEELRTNGHEVRTQVPLPVIYRGIELEHAYRIDMLVDDDVLVELKTVEKLTPIHTAQLLTYLKFSQRRIGLLLNFHTLHLRDGIKRLVNG